MAYATQIDLEDAMGATVVAQIYGDSNTGVADSGPIAWLLAEAQSRVDSYLRPMYAIPLAAPVPNIIKSLTVDVAIAIARDRHPEYVRADGEALMKRAIEDLKRLRSGEMALDVPKSQVAEPLNNRVAVGGSAMTLDPPPRPFNDDMGDF